MIPISSTQDTAGPMARNVTDAAILLSALTGVDNNDEVTKNSSGKTHQDYTQFLTKDAFKGKKIGIEKSFLRGHEAVVGLYKKAIEQLKTLGAEVVEIDFMSQFGSLGGASYTVLLCEFKDGVNTYLSKANAKVKTLKEVIAFNQANEAKAMPYFKQELLESSQNSPDLNSTTYKDAVAKSTSSRKMINDILKKDNLDAIMGTSFGIPCHIDLFKGDYGGDFYFCSPAAMAGFPTLPYQWVKPLSSR